ncbi:MAG: hypothetical protein IKO42_03305 [Opitutales bacterium]|nr:hypothetical protein [Opitutales bacterium]
MNTTKNKIPRGKRAFALVLAIGAMAFMVLLTLTLSAVISSKLRILNAQKENSIARKNALLGMCAAISNLQRSLGPDMAISAPATIFDSDPETVKIDDVKTPYVFGAFKVHKGEEFSTLKDWQDKNREAAEQLRARSQVETADIEWLVSSNVKLKNPASEALSELNDEVVKLAEYKMLEEYPDSYGGEVNANKKTEDVEVLAGKISVGDGAYAWWASDESAKAKINLTRPEKYLDGKSTGSASSFSAPSDSRVAQISNVGFVGEIAHLQLNPFLPSFDEERAKNLAKMNSMDEFAIVDKNLSAWAAENKGDYTVCSVGLPVDVTQGRLKEDLSVYLFSGRGLRDADPIIRGDPASDKDYIGAGLGLDNYTSNLPRFGLLKDFANMVSDRENGSDAKFETAVEPKGQKSTPSEVQHGIFPVVSAITYHFQLFYDNNLSTDDSLNLYLMFYPRVRIWNPHSVRLEKSDYVLKIGLPYTIQVFAAENPLKSGGSRTIGAFMARGDTVSCQIDPDDPETAYFYNPYAMYRAGSSNGAFEKHFTEVFRNRMLSRGKGVRSSGNLSGEGMPAISLAIKDLALNPGENVELTIQNTREFMDSVFGTPDGVVRSKNISAMPQLAPGVVVHPSARTIQAGKGGAYFSINLNSKVATVVSKAPLSPAWDGEPFSNLKPYVSGGNLKSLHANWRVVPSYFLTDVRAQERVKFPPRPSYELWRVSGKNAPEFLTSMDFTALNSSGNPNVNDGKGFYNDYYFVEGQNEHNSVFMPYRFSTVIAWDNSILREWAGTSSYRGYFNYGYMKQPPNCGWYQIACAIGTGLAGYFTDAGVYQYENGAAPANILPRIPSKNELINGALGVNTFNGGTSFVVSVGGNTVSPDSPYYNSSSGSNFPMGMLADGGSATFDGAHNSRLEPDQKGSILITSHSWAMCSYSAPKGWGGITSSSRVWPWPMLSNFMRDSGEACRVFKPHGMVAPLVCLQGDPPRKSLLAETHFELSSGTWTSYNLMDSNGKIPNSSAVKGSMAWVSRYSNTGDSYPATSRYCAPVLMDCKISGSYLNYFDWALITPIFDYPRCPDDIMSLAAFSNANLSMLMWQPTFAFAESFASPFVRRDSLVNSQDKVLHDNELIDLSYLLNYSMWDRFFISTFPQKNPPSNIFGGMRLNNTRNFLTSAPEEKNELYGSDLALQNAARFVGIDGAFNVNSTSYEAWRAVLGGLLGTRKKSVLEGEYPERADSSDPSKFCMPNPGNLNPLLSPQDDEFTFGFRDAQAGRNISEADIDRLAREIVAEVKRRAPFFGLADFVNRRLVEYSEAKSDEDLGYRSLMGTIAAAIDRLENRDYESRQKGTFFTDSNFSNRAATESLTNMTRVFKEYADKDEFMENSFCSLYGKKYQRFMGLPGAVLKQSQILNAIGPVITARGDTFVIRAYGEHKNPLSGSVAKSYCEAVVQRAAEPVMPGDDKIAPVGKFGRKFKIVSFRWISPNEL